MKYRTRLTFRRLMSSLNEDGEQVGTWEDLFSSGASVKAYKGTEKIDPDGRLIYEETFDAMLRVNSGTNGLTASDRVVLNDKEFFIVLIDNETANRGTVKIMAKREILND